MAAVDITCPHCNRAQKVAEHRLTESVYCLACQQLITDVYLYKIAPKAPELTIKLKGRIISEFGTTKLDELKSKSDEYTGKFEPVNEDDSDEFEARDDTTRGFESSGYQAAPKRSKLSTAARTYLIGGIVVAVLAAVITVIGVAMMSDDVNTGEIEARSADGTRTERYPSGARKAEWRVISAGGVEMIEGQWQEWHEDGAVMTLGNYANGEKVGDWRGWHANGKPSFEGRFEAGKEVGRWTEWHANGRKSVEGAYVASGKQGEWRTWFKDGGYASLEAYDQGVPVGDWVSWYENGKEKLRGTYVNGLREGTWSAFHDNGTEDRIEGWKGGVLHGESWGSYRDRQRSFQGRWDQGRRDGEWSWWHANGKLQRKGTFIEGLEQDYWQEWHQSGALKEKGAYSKGRPIGTWEEYDEDGSLAGRREYTEDAETTQTWFFRGVEVQRHTETFPDGSVRAEWSTTTTPEGIERRHGRQRTYYSTGVLAESGAWLNGEREGTWRTYDANGTTLTEETWANGKKVE